MCPHVPLPLLSAQSRAQMERFSTAPMLRWASPLPWPLVIILPQGFPWPSSASPLALVSVSSGAEETSGGLAETTAAAVAPAAAATLVPRKGKGAAADASVTDGGGAAGKGGGGSADRASYRNPAEALLALAVTESLLAAGDVSSAAILTPYRGQVVHDS